MGSRLQALWAKVKQQCLDIFDKDKGLFILIAIVAIIVKFRDLLLDYLINSAKRVDRNAKKQDSKLANQEAQLKQQADEMVKKAQQEPTNEEPITNDWYKKKD